MESLGTSWHSYPKIYSFGHSAIKEIFEGEVHAEEKIDGSQFSFGVFGGEIKIRSKGVQMELNAPEKMFHLATLTVRDLAPILNDGWTYRAEYLQKAKHNVLAYDRTPKKHLIIFDINNGEEHYLSWDEKKKESDRIGLECVPRLFQGKVSTPEQFLSYLDSLSCLGGQKIEGIVVKNYALFGKDKKCLMGKHVSEAFKEKHKVDWKTENPGKMDVVQALINSYRTGALILETKVDLEAECGTEIREMLFQWAFPQIARAVAGGLPEYYKDQLVKKQFEVAAGT